MNPKFTHIISLLVGLLMLSTSALYAQPANNECSGAIDVSGLFDGGNNTSTLFDNTGATNEASDPAIANGAACFAEGTIDNSIWFSFVGDGTTYTIRSVQCSATAASYVTSGDTQFALYTGGCAGLTPVTNGCNEDGPGATAGNFFAEITVETVAGTTYHLLVDGFANANGPATGEFCLNAAPFEVITACDSGTPVTTGAIEVLGDTATFDLEIVDFSVPNSPEQGQLWWIFSPTANAGGGPFDGGGFGQRTDGSDTFTSTLNGTSPALTGTWEVFVRVTSTLAINTPCEDGDVFLTILFDATPIVEDCFAGNLITNDTVFVNDSIPTFTLTTEDRIIPFDGSINGGYTWFFTPGPDGTGALGGAFSFGNITTESSTFDNDLNGVLSANNFPPFGGTWFVFGQASTDGTNITTLTNTVCDVTTDSLTVVFDALDPGPCDAGSFVSTETQIVCVGDQVGVALENGTDTIPLGGNLGFLFDNTTSGGTGGVPGGTLLTNSSSPASFDNDLNGILSDNGFPPLEGAFVLRSAVLDATGALCSISADSILVLFGEVVDLQIIEEGLELTAFPGVNFMDFTYAWSTGETTQIITVPTVGEYSVTITDGLGCTTEASTLLVSTNEADIVNNLSVSPNPTSGLLNVALDLPGSEEVQLSVIDITGKEVINLAPVTFASRNFEVDLQDQAAGLYLLRFRIGNDVVTRRVVKN